VEVAVVVEAAVVAGGEPAVREEGVQVGGGEVAAEEGGAAELDLVVVVDPELGARERRPAPSSPRFTVP
jgi:hypothetical protein